MRRNRRSRYRSVFLESVGGADAFEINIANRRAVERMEADTRLGILQISANEHIANDVDVIKDIVGFGNEFPCFFGVGIADVEGDDPFFGGVEIRSEVEEVAVISEKTKFVLEGGDDGADHAVRFAKILVINLIALGGAFPGGDDEVVAIFADVGAEAPFGIVGAFIDQDIAGLGRADAMVKDFLIQVDALEGTAGFGFGITAIEEAMAVGRP